MSLLSIEHLYAQYPGIDRPVLQDISLSIDAGQRLVILGPSGSGKSTLLNLVAGFTRPLRGRLTLDGRPICGPAAERGVVFQEHALLPWRNALENVAFGLQLAGWRRAERNARALQLLRQVGLEQQAAAAVDTLSGGQRQRVGLARALATEPRLLLLDEPFAALDAFTREQMQTLLLQVCQASQRAFLLITHDIEEAIFLASELVLLDANPGRIRQRLSLDFSARFAAGESVRSIKSDPQFIATREQLLASLFAAPTRACA